MNTNQKLRHAAVHEAGGAVVARMLGLTCGRATLVPDYEEPAEVAYFFEAVHAFEWRHHHSHRYRDDRAFWHGKIIATMAGAEAEREILGSCLEGNGHGRQQWDLVGDNLGYSDDWSKRAARLRRFARQLVKRHRSAILHFAKQLIAADQLDDLLAR